MYIAIIGRTSNNYMKRNNFKIIYEKKPKITIMGWRFSVIFQKSTNDYHKQILTGLGTQNCFATLA